MGSGLWLLFLFLIVSELWLLSTLQFCSIPHVARLAKDTTDLLAFLQVLQWDFFGQVSYWLEKYVKFRRLSRRHNCWHNHRSNVFLHLTPLVFSCWEHNTTNSHHKGNMMTLREVSLEVSSETTNEYNQTIDDPFGHWYWEGKYDEHCVLSSQRQQKQQYH